jgi:hypothetical protein
MNETMDATLWWCENCQTKGRVEFAADAGVWEVFQMLADLHRATTPECATAHGAEGVRVVPASAENQKPEEGTDAA